MLATWIESLECIADKQILGNALPMTVPSKFLYNYDPFVEHSVYHNNAFKDHL